VSARPKFPPQTFRDYCFNAQAPLVASVKDALRIRRYVQMHSLPVEVSADTRAARGGPEGYDGVAELWWDSFEDMALTGSDPAARGAGRSLLGDGKGFIDLSKSPLWWGQEREIISAR